MKVFRLSSGNAKIELLVKFCLEAAHQKASPWGEAPPEAVMRGLRNALICLASLSTFPLCEGEGFGYAASKQDYKMKVTQREATEGA